jgi:hypothetical protein
MRCRVEKLMVSRLGVEKARHSVEFAESQCENIHWLKDDVMYRLYVRQKIETGLKDVELGRTLPVSEVRKRFGLPE